MIVTVVPVFDSVTDRARPLWKVMEARLKKLAIELADVHLKKLKPEEPFLEDVVIYLSYNSKFSIRWKVVNDVPPFILQEVERVCRQQGYLEWKASTVDLLDLRSDPEGL